MSTYRWNHAHALTVQARAYLCYQATEIYGLQRPRPRSAPPRASKPVPLRPPPRRDHPPARRLPPPNHLLHLLVIHGPPRPVPRLDAPLHALTERKPPHEHARPHALPAADESESAAPETVVCQGPAAEAGEGGSGGLYDGVEVGVGGGGGVKGEKGVGFEDMTALGRNLYNLLVGGRAPPAAPSSAGIPTVASGDSGTEGLGVG
ncbi:hypothetical protein V497_02992, partial [Pseudogymnoascus sp. VKM F-4516 (FW-969)]